MLNGYIQCGASAAINQTIATFPAGHLPAFTATFSANKRDTSGGVIPVILRILNTGELQIYSAPSFAAFDTIPLTGLQFVNYN